MDTEYSERPIAFKLYNKTLENVDNTANVNPFTPDSGWLIESSLYKVL